MSQQKLILLAWVVVLLELILPIPGLLTLGAVYVLIARPAWFLPLMGRMVEDGDPRADP